MYRTGFEYDIAIVGGGASGLMAAALAFNNGKRVVLLEKNEVCGRKLLITGKGKCNITNTRGWEEFSAHVHPNAEFFKQAFFGFSNSDTIDFFHSIGLETVCERGQRVFPKSGKSSDVRDSLLRRIQASENITVMTGTEVTSIRKESGEFRISVLHHRKVYSMNVIRVSKVLIATGGLSYPLTGSTGDGYRFAEIYGHRIVNTHPSLTALVPAISFSGLAGLTLRNVNLSLFIDGGLVQSEFGEISFTNGGLEGALGFRVSRNAVSAMVAGKLVEVSIDLKPALTAEQIKHRIQREYTPGIKFNTYLEKMLPVQIIQTFITTSKGLSIHNLPVRIKNWKFGIKGYVDYSRAVITAGGVSLQNISRKTMESRICPGMYFIGEVLDLDADTGGYNLQIAFSTAASAIRAASS